MKPDGTNNADGTAAPATAAAATSAAYPPTAPPPLHPYAVGPGPGPSPVMVAPSGSPSTDPCMSLLIVLWVVLLPPVAVALAGGDLASILINVLFTMLGFLPGERENKIEEMRGGGGGAGFGWGNAGALARLRRPATQAVVPPRVLWLLWSGRMGAAEASVRPSAPADKRGMHGWRHPSLAPAPLSPRPPLSLFPCKPPTRTPKASSTPCAPSVSVEEVDE